MSKTDPTSADMTVRQLIDQAGQELIHLENLIGTIKEMAGALPGLARSGELETLAEMAARSARKVDEWQQRAMDCGG
jgi:hypothetical protein